MQQPSSATARIAAAIALLGGVIAIVVVIASSGGGPSGGTAGLHLQHRAKPTAARHRQHPKTYVVKPGDTLTAIAHKTGVPVREILALNPEVDPQILIAGESLKLK